MVVTLFDRTLCSSHAYIHAQGHRSTQWPCELGQCSIPIYHQSNGNGNWEKEEIFSPTKHTGDTRSLTRGMERKMSGTNAELDHLDLSRELNGSHMCTEPGLRCNRVIMDKCYCLLHVGGAFIRRQTSSYHSIDRSYEAPALVVESSESSFRAELHLPIEFLAYHRWLSNVAFDIICCNSCRATTTTHGMHHGCNVKYSKWPISMSLDQRTVVHIN